MLSWRRTERIHDILAIDGRDYRLRELDGLLARQPDPSTPGKEVKSGMYLLLTTPGQLNFLLYLWPTCTSAGRSR